MMETAAPAMDAEGPRLLQRATPVVGATLQPEAPRSGAELIRATQPFQIEKPFLSWFLLATTLAAIAATITATIALPWWPLKLLSGVITGLIQVRLFIFYHDALHGAIFRTSPLARMLMDGLGFYLVAPKRVWMESHDFHHQNNAKIWGAGIGSFPLMSQERVAASTGRKRVLYQISRHPLTILGGYLSVFMFGLVIGPFIRAPKNHWRGMAAASLHYVLLAAMIWHFGWMTGICAVLVPSMVAMGVGSYLFYAQHNFPTMTLYLSQDWTFTRAALGASSMFDMSRMMHWFTGNIGYHHVHHLNHRIPFYRLPEAMQAIPELQQPERTSWRLRDIRACFRLFAWDHAQGRMLSRSEIAA